MGGNFNNYKEPTGADTTVHQGDQKDANGDAVTYAPGKKNPGTVLASGKNKGKDKK